MDVLPHCCQQRTTLFDLHCSRFVAVSVGQDLTEDSRLDPMALPPAFTVTVRVTTDYGARSAPLELHWGVSSERNGKWGLPLPFCDLPAHSTLFQNSAVRTPFKPLAKSTTKGITIKLGAPQDSPPAIHFVLYDPANSTFVKPGTNLDFFIPVRSVIAQLQMELVRHTLRSGRSLYGTGDSPTSDISLHCPSYPDLHHVFELVKWDADLDVAIWASDEAVIIDIITNLLEAVVLHWGLITARPALMELKRQTKTQSHPNLPSVIITQSDHPDDWEKPDSRMRPPDNIELPEDSTAVETLFHRGLQGPEASIIQSVRLVFPYDVILEKCLETATQEFQASSSWSFLENASKVDELQRDEWVLPVLKDKVLQGTPHGAFPQRLAFVLRSRDDPSVYIHNETPEFREAFEFSLCRLTEETASPTPAVAEGKVIRHGGKADSLVKGNFEISIPFSDSFKGKLFALLQKAYEQFEMEIKMRQAEFIPPNSDILETAPSSDVLKGGRIFGGSGGTGKNLMVQPLLSSREEMWPSRAAANLSDMPAQATTPSPAGLASVMNLLIPTPVPGTVVFFATYRLNDSSQRGFVHVLAVEECAPARGDAKPFRVLNVVVKVHIMVSVNVPCVVHWGFISDRNASQWIRPDPSIWPDGTEPFDSVSVDSPMKTDPRNRICRLELKIPQTPVLHQRSTNFSGISFVLRDVMTDTWIKGADDRDMFIKIRRERYPDFLARQWRGTHTALVVRLLQNELHFDPPWLVNSTQKYFMLQQLTQGPTDGMDIDYWAWVFVWWRFSHIRIFDWQRHAHSRPWEAVEVASSTFLSIVARWRSSPRSRPIIKLLINHILITPVKDDIRKDMHKIFTSWNLLNLPFFGEWYRRVYSHVGVEDFAICRSIIVMLRSMKVEAFWSSLSFYGWQKKDIGFVESPVIPPSFAFLQSQLRYLANFPKSTPAIHTNFIGRHVKHQTLRLNQLVNALEALSYKLQSLFFGLHTDVAAQTIEENASAELKGIFKSIKEVRASATPSCPSSSEVSVSLSVSEELFILASKGRCLSGPMIMNCTDTRTIRDYLVADLALDNLQQDCLARLFGFSGPVLNGAVVSSMLQAAAAEFECDACGRRHMDANSRASLMLPLMRSNGCLEPAETCRKFRVALAFRHMAILTCLLPGLRLLHPSEEETKGVANDWNVYLMTTLEQHLSTDFIDNEIDQPLAHPKCIELLIQQALDDSGDVLNLIASICRRIERCAIRIMDLCLVYLSEKVNFMFNCLKDLDLYASVLKASDRLEALCNPPHPPRGFSGNDPFLALLPPQEIDEHEAIDTTRSEYIRRDVQAFVLGVVLTSSLFWIAVVLARLEPILRSLTYVPKWRNFSNVNFATGVLVSVKRICDLKGLQNGSQPAFSKSVILVVERATGRESIPFNTQGVVIGPETVDVEQGHFLCAPTLTSPMALQARQMGILCVVAEGPETIKDFIKQCVDRAFAQQVEVLVPENMGSIILKLAGEEESTKVDDALSPVPTAAEMEDEETVLADLVFERLNNPVEVSEILPLQRGPLLPSLASFCAQTSNLLLPLGEEPLSSNPLVWKRRYPMAKVGTAWSPFLHRVPVISPDLYDKLYLTSRWFISPKDFTPLLVGRKGMGISYLRKMFEQNDEYRQMTCPTIAVPMGALEATLRDPENHVLSERLQNLLRELQRLNQFSLVRPVGREESTASIGSLGPALSTASSRSGPDFLGNGEGGEMCRSQSARRSERLLRECRGIIRNLHLCSTFLLACSSLAQTREEDDWDFFHVATMLNKGADKLWLAIKNVWCSSFTPGVWHSARVLGLPPDMPRFTVIIQKQSHVNYSFTIENTSCRSFFTYHSKEAMGITKASLYGEIQSGVCLKPGELFCGGLTQVGWPMAFTDAGICCYSSQAHTLKPKRASLSFRPDGNIYGQGRLMPSGGLVCVSQEPLTRSRFECHLEPLYTNAEWRKTTLQFLCELQERIDAKWQAFRQEAEHLSVEGLIVQDETNMATTKSEWIVPGSSDFTCCQHVVLTFAVAST